MPVRAQPGEEPELSTFYDRALVKWSTNVCIGLGIIGVVTVIVGSGPLATIGGLLLVVGVFSALAAAGRVIAEHYRRRHPAAEKSSGQYYAGPEQAGWRRDCGDG